MPCCGEGHLHYVPPNPLLSYSFILLSFSPLFQFLLLHFTTAFYSFLLFLLPGTFVSSFLLLFTSVTLFCCFSCCFRFLSFHTTSSLNLIYVSSRCCFHMAYSLVLCIFHEFTPFSIFSSCYFRLLSSLTPYSYTAF